MRVYVAGPYTVGDVTQNVRNAIDAADRLLKAGHAPYVPHLSHFWHLVHPGPYAQWAALDLEWVRCCYALVRLPGESAGADREVAFANEVGCLVYFSVEKFLDAVGTVKILR